MKTLDKKTLYAISIVIVVTGSVTGVYVLYQKPLATHSYDTILSTVSTNQTLPTIAACTGVLGQSKNYLFQVQSKNFTTSIDPILQHLDNLTISCNSPKDILLMPDNFANMGGQCCGAVTDTKKYNEQIEGLKKFSYISDVPSNPYDIPVVQVKKMLTYDANTILTTEENSTLTVAAKMSDDGGPCCCKCWHWYFNEGVAKEMITEYNFTSKQVADFYNLSDTCGT
ncbi:MAG: hypothetical protein LV477_01580 [Candidatus Nitrosotalea sp.]|nr:hypothetical protein [Candidatus Nitrosotalea sp.]